MRQSRKSFESVPIRSLPLTVIATASRIPAARPLRTALVVDDDPEVADTLAQMLNANGFLAEAAYSGEEGLARAREIRPGLVITDVGLPEMDGLTMADEIYVAMPKTKIVLICEQLPNNMEIATWSVLKKPIRAMELLAMVSRPEDREV